MRVVIATLLGVAALSGSADKASAAASQPRAAAAKPLGVRLDRSHAGTPAPATPFTTKDGKPATVADFRGRAVLVNLWATWCAPCIAELPDLDALAGRPGAPAVLTISQDLGGWRAVDRFWTPGRFRRLIPRLDARGDYAQAVGAAGLPVSILYDAAGRERWRVNGPVAWTSAEAGVELR